MHADSNWVAFINSRLSLLCEFITSPGTLSSLSRLHWKANNEIKIKFRSSAGLRCNLQIAFELGTSRRKTRVTSKRQLNATVLNRHVPGANLAIGLCLKYVAVLFPLTKTVCSTEPHTATPFCWKAQRPF